MCTHSMWMYLDVTCINHKPFKIWLGYENFK